MKRRILAMLMVIVMLVGSVPVQAFATESNPRETTPCPVEGCTYGAGHSGECSTFVACGQEGCTYASDHEGNCSNDMAPEQPKAEPAADASVYVTVSNRGELAMAYEAVTVSDINADGKLTVDEALYAAHAACGKGYASENGTVTKLWDVETTNVSFFVNHEPISTDVRSDTIRQGDYLVASVDQDAANDYDKYSRFDSLEVSVRAGESFTLTLTDNIGNALAGMEVGLWNGNGSSVMTGMTTDVNGFVTLTLNQEGLYCVTAKGTVVESSIDVNTLEITSIEVPIIAPVCIVKVSGTAVQETVTAHSRSESVSNVAANTAAAASTETELSVSGNVITLAEGTYVNNDSRCPVTMLTITAEPEVTITGAVQNGTTVDVVLAGGGDSAAAVTAVLASSNSNYRLDHTNNTCTLSDGEGQIALTIDVYSGMMPYPVITGWPFQVNITMPVGDAYTVTPPAGEGFTFTGKDSVYEGKDYTFTLAVNEGYDGTNMVVMVNGTAVTGTDGTYTVAAVSENLTITVEGIVKKELCTVTLTEGEGYTISSDDIPYKAEDYIFTVVADAVHYKADTLQVLLDGEPMTGVDGTYTIPALGRDHVVTVTIDKKAEYTVTKNGMDGVTISGADTVLETDPYTFTVSVDNAYDSSEMVITVNEEPVTLTDGSYTIDSAAGNITIAVTGVKAKIVYDVTLTKGTGYTISGQETSYAGEPYTFTVTVDDALYFADQIQVKINGESVALTDGQYTIEALSGDTTVTVENVVERRLFTVIKPDVEGVTFTGEDSVREGKPYTFTIAVADGYDCSNMLVTLNGQPITLDNGSYTVASAAEDMTVSVENVTAKEICMITLTEGTGYTISGALTAYKGDSYSFTVAVKSGYSSDAMVVYANGTAVDSTDGTYTITVDGDTTITVEGVKLPDVSGESKKPEGNVLDITDKTVYSLSKYYANVTNITLSGATVTEFYENGTVIDVMLDYTTPDNAEISVTFGTSLNRCTMEGTAGTVTLENGEAVLSMTLTGKYASSLKGTATYTLRFRREVPKTEVPVCVKTSDSAELYKNTTLTLNLGSYFTGAESFYLVEADGSKTALTGSTYSTTPTAAGILTLVFGAANIVGECPDRVTVTVTVKEITGGTWIGYETSNGALNFVQFTDENGNAIDGLTAFMEGTAIQVSLPKTYAANGKITATFNLTQTNGLPFITTSNAASGSSTAANNKFTAKTTTLSGGAGKLTFYLYNANPKATSNSYTTFTLTYAVRNDLPVLAEGVAATAEAAITAGENYTLDLRSVFTDADGDALTYLVSINGAAAVAADADYSYTTDTAGTYTLVFTANDGKGTSTAAYTVTLTVKDSDKKEAMTVQIPEGLEPKFYVSSGYEEGVDQLGTEVTAQQGETADGMTAYTLRYPANATMLSVRTDDWGGMAFAAAKDTSVTLRKVQMQVVDYDNNTANSTNSVIYGGNQAVSGTEGWLLATGGEYTFQAVPSDTDAFSTTAKTEILEAGTDVYTVNLVLGLNNPITVTVPTGAEARLYNYDTGKYYYATELEAKIIADNGDGTTTYSFVGNTKVNGTCYIYRVTKPGMITKARYLQWGEQNHTVTYTDSDKADTYRLDDYSAAGQANSSVTEDSVLLNINGQNHLAMSVGQTKTLKAYRAWEIVKISYQNYIITPDFTYTVLSGSDVVSLTEMDSPSVGEGDWMTLKALKEGTAVIEVTYGAMEVTGGNYDGIYGASDPARTGLVVVQVGGSDTSVSFGIEGFSSRGSAGSQNITYNPNAKRAWDAEFDTLYFTGSSGQLKFSPTASGTIIQAAVSQDKGNSWTILTDEEGVYTASIASGNNILRVTTDRGVAYQVVRGDKVGVAVTEQTGDGDGKMEPGEIVRITLQGLHMPIPKMAGNYNPGYYGNNDGYSSTHLNYSVNGQNVYGPGTQYNFITAANYLDIAIPEDIQTDSLTLSDGYIGVGVVGLTEFDNGGDSHRNIPDNGCGTRGTKTTWHTRSILPEVTVTIQGLSVSVTGVSLDETELNMKVGETRTLTATVEPEDADNKNVTWSSDNLTVARAADGEITAVGAGTATITVTTEDGEKTASCAVTVIQPVESVTVAPETAEVEVGKTVTLTATVLPENASDQTLTWTSSDETIAVVEDGVVTGVKAGSVTITAAAGEKTSSCTVTVKEIPENTAVVYFSVSHDAEFLKAGETGKVMALQKLTVPYFDLEPYGLGDFRLPADHADYGKPTMLHLYIYATELFRYKIPAEEAGKGYLKDYIGSDVFAYSGAAGSICIDKFWGMDMNLNYYHNYQYPADDTGYGVTADRVILKDGDIVTIGHFTSWKFYGDSTSIFNYLAAGEDTVVTTAAQNDMPQLQVYRAGPDLGGGGTNTPVQAVRDIWYVASEALVSGDVTAWTKLGTTDETGKLKADLTDLAVGQYILAVAGQKGVEYPDDIVSTPGGIVLNVTENTLPAAVQNVIAKIKGIGEVTLDCEQTIIAAREAYDALDEIQKAQVHNYQTLLDAEAKLEALKQAAADSAAIDAVIEKIDAIGDVTLEKEEAVKAAREAYDALTDVQKELVTNYETLIAAETALEQLKAIQTDKEAAKAVDDLIESIGETITEASEADIKAAREAYDALTDTQKSYVEKYQELLDAEESLRLLKLSNADILGIYRTTGSYLSGLEAPGVGSINGEWRVIGLSRSGQTVPDAYFDAVVEYVKANWNADGRLHENKSTDNSRIILALTAIGKDVTDVGGYNLLSGLDEMDYIGNQGINGMFYALLAFDSHDYDIPAGDVTRETLIAAILDAQLSDGGWALAGTVSDPDMTGMALQALAPYYDANAAVMSAVDEALQRLSETQNSDGSFSGSEGTTCESLAQVITALTALGINPETDERFVKNGVSALDALAAFYVEGGGFRHGLTGDRNMMATEQGYYALVSYYRFLENKNSLYDMTDVTIETSAANQAAANRVIELINAIGTVDLTKGDEIEAARAAYDDLTETQQALVSNYSTLTAAERKYAELVKTAEDEAQAAAVEALIDAIGTVDLSKEDEIEAARNAYNRLTTVQKRLVRPEYLDKLEAAEERLAELKQEALDAEAVANVIALINRIDTDKNKEGIQINSGSAAAIQTARNAYNNLRNDTLRGRVTNRQDLFDAEEAWELLNATVSVTFTLLGCYKHGTGETAVHTLANSNLQTWIAAKTYKVKPGSTVKDLFEQALTAAGMQWSNPTGNYVESITRNGVKIGEFTNGTKSGWMYTLNGKHPGLGIAQQTLVNGDKVVFHYTDDYTQEEGNTSGSNTGTTTGTGTGTASGSTNYITTTTTTVNAETAEAVDRLIEDIGEEITLDSEAKILAARAAYDKLTEDQKKLVKKYADLVAAEAKLAELKAASGENENAYLVTGDYLQGLGTPGVGTVGGEWMVIGLARSGRSVPSGYYDHVLRYVSENINEKQQLHSAKSSDNSRLILALTAIGRDVTDVDGHDLLKGLNDMDYIQKQGINGPIWALLAFDSGNYPVPEGNVSRQKLIDVILEAQLSDGGWALSGERSDPDMTGMAIQALAAYMESNMDVKKAVEKATWTLSEMQNDNGSYTSVDGPNCESIAQVITALAALGIDADTDARFVKNGISALDALLSYYIPGGGFRHVLDGNLDGMATEQAYYALVAYNRMQQNQNFLYDMTDVIDMGGDVIVEEPSEPIEAPTEPVAEEDADNGNAVVIWTGVMTVCAAAIAVLLLNRKKLFGKFL